MRCGELGRYVTAQPVCPRILRGFHPSRSLSKSLAISCEHAFTVSGRHFPQLAQSGRPSSRLAASWRSPCPYEQRLDLFSAPALVPRSLPSHLTSSLAGRAADRRLLPVRAPEEVRSVLPASSNGLITSLRTLVAAHGTASTAEAPASDWVAFFATCHPGLEQVVARELEGLGYRDVEPSKAGVAFRGRRVSDGYAANLWLRSAIRVLVLLAEGRLGTDPGVGRRGGQSLYELVYDAAPWHELIPPGRTFSVEPRLWDCTDISSTRLVWSRVKDAVCDSIRQYRPDKPQPPERGQVADVPLYVSCYRDSVKIFRDMSGESLHRRGYRDVMHLAALNESAAAGVLALSGWREAVEAAGDGEGLVLADPMCGSGTFLIEAALIARDIAPGLMRSLDTNLKPAAGAASAAGTAAQTQGARRSSAAAASASASGGSLRKAPLAPWAWPFQRWGDYDAAAWEDVVSEARERVRPTWRGRLLGVDVHEGALSLAVRQANKAGVYKMLELTHGDCGSVVPGATPQLVVCNPPWGGRLNGDGGAYGEVEVHEYDSMEARGALPGGNPYLRPGQRRLDGGGGGAAAGDQERDDDYLATAWRSLDGFLYRQCPGASASLLSGNPSAFRYLKLKPQTKHRLVLSGVDVQVATYKIRDAASRATALQTASYASDLGDNSRHAQAGFVTPTSAPALASQSAERRDRPAAALTASATKRRKSPAPAPAAAAEAYADDGYWVSE